MSNKEEINHLDLIGQEIHAGNFVAAYDTGRMQIFRVEKLTSKMVSLEFPSQHKIRYRSRINKYPSDLVVLNDALVIEHILKTY